MKKQEKKEELLGLIDINKRSYFILELASKVCKLLCLTLIISSLTIIIISTSIANFVLSSIAFFLLLTCIILYFLGNFFSSLMPKIDKAVTYLTEYYDISFKEKEDKKSENKDEKK